MERISGFHQIIRKLYQTALVLLSIIIVCTAIQYDFQISWVIFAVAMMYGLYLYYHLRYRKPTTIGYFVIELAFILLLVFSGSHLAVYLFPLLIFRRAAYAQPPGIYLEVVLTSALYLGVTYISYTTVLDNINDVCMIGLAAVLAQPMVQIAQSLQADREKLLLRLDKVEESYHQATELALRDGLTGLYNYRALQAHIGGIDDAGFAILLIDVDRFKDFNDQYGHIVGDQVLVKIGQTILENVRRRDKVYRYGGEEFAVVLEDTSDELAMFTAERIRQRVANQTIECDGQLLNGVTISMGVATFDEAKIASCAMLEQADKALYEAKAKGRNKVVFFAEPNLSM